MSKNINSDEPSYNKINDSVSVKYLANDTIINFSRETVDKIRILIEKTYYRDIEYNLSSKSRWKIVGDITETIAHLLIGIGILLAFASGFFNLIYMSFISGSCSTGALIFIKFSSYSMRENKERTKQVNKLIGKLGFDQIPDISIDSAGNDLIEKKNILDI